MRRSQTEAAATRGLLLAHARRQFARIGYAATSLDRICSSAGVTKGAIFHHFSGKQVIFRAIVEELESELTEEATAAAKGCQDPLNAFVAAARVALTRATSAEYQRIVIIDGPSVLGFREWHAIDARFGLPQIQRALVALAPGSDDRYRKLEATMLLGFLNQATVELGSDEPGFTIDDCTDLLRAMLTDLAGRQRR